MRGPFEACKRLEQLRTKQRFVKTKPCYGVATTSLGRPSMKPTETKGKAPKTFARPTPKVTRLKPAKVLSAAERAAFLAARPDLKGS